jgi:DNA-binding transcriptional regulator YhcF (GntR family)
MQIRVDRSSDEALCVQIARQIRLHVSTGRLPPGRRLPTARALAAELAVNFHTVRAAYLILQGESLVEIRGRAGTCVTRRGTVLVGDIWRWRRIRAQVELLAEELEGSAAGPEAAIEVVTSELRRVLRMRGAALRAAEAGAKLRALPGGRPA